MSVDKETFETWNKIASLYEDKFMNLDLYNETYDYICRSIEKSNPKLLDVGCGPGNITKYLLSKRPDFDILGIDIAPNMIDLARKNNPSAEFAIMDSRDIDSLDAKFDGIIAGFCLPYLTPNEALTLISNSNKLLNRNGIIYLSFVEGDSSKSGYKSGNAGRVYFHFHDLNNLKDTLLNEGFGDLKLYKVDFKNSEDTFDIHTILIAIKQ